MRHLDEVIWLFRTRPLDRYQCLFLAGGFSTLLPVKLFPLGRHPPQDGDDKADGHLDVRRELAQVLAGIGMMCLTIGHGCSRLNRSSQSSRTRTMICRCFGEKQARTPKETGEGRGFLAFQISNGRSQQSFLRHRTGKMPTADYFDTCYMQIM